jgi:hypothetical protein
MSCTHNICKDCWEERNPGTKPVRLKERHGETCCFCGRKNKDGIFVMEKDRSKVTFCKCKE